MGWMSVVGDVDMWVGKWWEDDAKARKLKLCHRTQSEAVMVLHVGSTASNLTQRRTRTIAHGVSS